MADLPYLYRKILSRIAKDNERTYRDLKRDLSYFRVDTRDINQILKELKGLGLIDIKRKKRKKVVIIKRKGLANALYVATIVVYLYTLIFIYVKYVLFI